MPKSYGDIGPQTLQIPPLEFTQALQEQKGGFNINDALHPQESLKEILKAFDIEYYDI